MKHLRRFRLWQATDGVSSIEFAIVGSFLTFLLSILGSSEMRIVESFIGAAVMTVFCWLLFVILLNLPFQLCPSFWQACPFSSQFWH